MNRVWFLTKHRRDSAHLFRNRCVLIFIQLSRMFVPDFCNHQGGQRWSATKEWCCWISVFDIERNFGALHREGWVGPFGNFIFVRLLGARI